MTLLLVFSVSGMIKLWSLNDLDKRDPGHVIYEDESKTMTSQNVQFIACSHLNTRMMLVICTNSWQIVDPSNLKQLIISECAIEGIQGCIIDIDRVAIGFADSTIVLFQLPRSKLVGKQIRERFGDSPTNIGNIDQPFVFALVKGISTSPTTPLWSTVQFHFDTRTSSDGRRRRVAYRVDQHGSLSVWHIPKNYDLLVNEFIRSRKPVVYEPTIRQSFAEVWNRLNPSPPNISGTDDDHFITATVYVGNQNKLFFGREDGSILMMNACHAIMNQLLDNPNIENINHRVLCGHSAAVNCFLYPYEDSPRYDSQILLSGDVKWRPLDDFMLLRCEDDSVYVWEIETCNLDRIVTGLITEDVMEACKEQIGLMDAEDEAGASQAVQMFRALKNKNVAVIKKIAAHGDDKNTNADMFSTSTAHLVLFNVDNLITGLLSMDYELSSHPSHFNDQNSIENKPSLSTLMSKKAEQHLHQNHLPNSNNNSGTNFLQSNSVSPKSIQSSNTTANNSLLMPQRWQTETGLYMDTARLLLSLLHAWNMDENLDPICLKNLKLLKPKVPICYGTISRKGHISLYMPYCTGKLPALNDLSYQNFSKILDGSKIEVCSVSINNSAPSVRDCVVQYFDVIPQPAFTPDCQETSLRRVSSTKSTDSTADNESQQIKQGWSNVAALHCVLLPDLVKPSTSYAAPRIDLLARRWQDNCIEIRDASQALLIREFERLGPQGKCSKAIAFVILYTASKGMPDL
uniref:Uncharacterized protein n=1 Tax=Ditylenchus dipsaci TaxID=166011 RepID=A0A915CPE1_9BILA